MPDQDKSQIKILTLKTFLTLVKKSAGTEMFRQIFAEVDGREVDITENGNLSCAFYVSGLLAIFGLIDKIHATVSGTRKAMEAAGWIETTEMMPGAVLVWDKPQDGSHNHQHIGFYLGEEQAISNIWQEGKPEIHHFTFGLESAGTHRPIIAIYIHEKLHGDSDK